MKKNFDNILSPAQMKQNELISEINKICEGLIYISETDAEIVPFTGAKAEVVTADVVLKQMNAAENTTVEEVDFNFFFSRLTKNNDWFGEREKEQARKFNELKKVLEENLNDLKVFKAGTVRLDIYIVGRDEEGVITGVKTKSVET